MLLDHLQVASFILRPNSIRQELLLA